MTSSSLHLENYDSLSLSFPNFEQIYVGTSLFNFLPP